LTSTFAAFATPADTLFDRNYKKRHSAWRFHEQNQIADVRLRFERCEGSCCGWTGIAVEDQNGYILQPF